jgi:murein DD-endopeptidase MepM/ murein hydrolase activator NlpD
VPSRPALAALATALALAPSASAALPDHPADTWRAPHLPASFPSPLDGPVESPFGYRWGRFHSGVDIGGWRATDIHAPLPGRVVYVGSSQRYRGYGNVLKIRHAAGVETMYAHLARALVRKGQRVEAGQHIATAGCTGSCYGTHLHFEVHVRGKPVNPMRWLKGKLHFR